MEDGRDDIWMKMKRINELQYLIDFWKYQDDFETRWAISLLKQSLARAQTELYLRRPDKESE